MSIAAGRGAAQLYGSKKRALQLAEITTEKRRLRTYKYETRKIIIRKERFGANFFPTKSRNLSMSEKSSLKQKYQITEKKI